MQNILQNVLELPACKEKRSTRDCKKKKTAGVPFLETTHVLVFVAWRARMFKMKPL